MQDHAIINSGVLKWPSPRTRICVCGKRSRMRVNTRLRIIAFSAPVRRFPGRSTAATSASDKPSKIISGK